MCIRDRFWINDKGKKFLENDLPISSQFSPIYSILIDDINNDENKDILMGGNQYRIKPEIGINDASHVSLFIGDGKGNFQVLPNKESGIFIRGQIRDILKINIRNDEKFIFALNNDSIKIYKFNL